MDKRLAGNIIVGFVGLLIGFALCYIFTPKPQPDVKLQAEYAAIKEHARITDSLLQVAQKQTQQDSVSLELAMENLRRLELDSIRINKINEKAHKLIRSLPPAGQDSFLRSRLPAVNPYE